MIDLGPASARMSELVTRLDDRDLDRPTPCGSATVGDLVDHLGMFASNFVKVAGKELDKFTSTPPAAFDAANLEPGWRHRLAADLVALADAWSAPEAWSGDTWVGGMHMPAAMVGVVALDELVVHGWDLAVAIGQRHEAPADEVDAVVAFVAQFDAPRDGRLFGPVVDVDPEAPPLQRLLGLTGRDPYWNSPD